MAPKLTRKQNKFIDKYIETGNGTLSALESYNANNKNTAHSIASENLRKPAIIKGIEDKVKVIMDSSKLNKDWILQNIIDIADNNKHKKPDTALKANELLGRSMALWKDSTQVEVSTHVPKSMQELDDEYKALIATNITVNDTPLLNGLNNNSNLNDINTNKTGEGEPEPNVNDEHG